MYNYRCRMLYNNYRNNTEDHLTSKDVPSNRTLSKFFQLHSLSHSRPSTEACHQDDLAQLRTMGSFPSHSLLSAASRENFASATMELLAVSQTMPSSSGQILY